ncbi:MAG: ROK family protein [Pleomorphochaeta sp.]
MTKTIENLTDNKRLVITLLRKHNKLTKKELASLGNMGWATVVKIINQLLDDKIVQIWGVSDSEYSKVGKSAISYTLSENYPLAIGIDNELLTTRIVLVNLHGDILFEKKYKTPKTVEIDESCKFLEKSIHDFIKINNIDLDLIKGIGIGKSGLSFPSIFYPGHINISKIQRKYLMKAFNTEVRIETNSRVYALFEQYVNEQFKYNDLFFLQIRKGIGTGIITDGNLYNGVQGLSGEISHIQVVENGTQCRCGNYGCMETVVNEVYLYNQYRQLILKENNSSEIINDKVLREGLADLFSLAANNNEIAIDIVKKAAKYLGYCISMAIIVLDIPNIIISGHFGEDGTILEKYLKEEIENQILKNMPLNVHYEPLDTEGFVQGAAFLILKDYLYNVTYKNK